MPFINDRINETRMQQELNKLLADESGDELADEAVTATGPTEDLASLRKRLLSRIVGQDHAIDVLLRSIAVAKAGLNDPERPLANILLLGPTGVGKTELVRQVAGLLRSAPDDLSRIDMSSLSQEHYMASLTGAPPGYAGAKENLSLLDRSKIAGNPYMPGIALFDEVEKAHRSVHRALLHVMDNGILTLASGQETISFRNTYVFMTSNLGSAELLKRRRSWAARFLNHAADGAGPAGIPLRRLLGAGSALVVREALEGFFEPEFINRIDEIIVFNPLTSTNLSDVVGLETNNLVRRCKSRGIDLVVDPEVSSFLKAQSFDPLYGARSVKRLLRARLGTPVAMAALAERGASGRHIRLAARLHEGDVSVGRVTS